MKLKHAETNQTIETTKDLADMYRSQGWVEVKPASKSKSEDK